MFLLAGVLKRSHRDRHLLKHTRVWFRKRENLFILAFYIHFNSWFRNISLVFVFRFFFLFSFTNILWKMFICLFVWQKVAVTHWLWLLNISHRTCCEVFVAFEAGGGGGDGGVEKRIFLFELQFSECEYGLRGCKAVIICARREGYALDSLTVFFLTLLANNLLNEFNYLFTFNSIYL